MEDYTESIPADLPRRPYNNGALREEVTIEELSTGTGIDDSHPMKWGMAIGEFINSLSQVPERPSQFADLSVNEIGNLTIGQCSKDELLVLLTWYNHKTGKLEQGSFEEDEKETKGNEKEADAAVIIQRIESVDETLLDELPDDYSNVGHLPRSLTETITDAGYAEKIDLGSSLNLNAIGIGLGLEKIIFKPDAFAGLFYRPNSESIEAEVMVVLFGSGAAICFANDKHDIERTEMLINEDLEGVIEPLSRWFISK